MQWAINAGTTTEIDGKAHPHGTPYWRGQKKKTRTQSWTANSKVVRVAAWRLLG
jgi:hypothetical protein